MYLDTKEVKRAGIYSFYDKDGIVDRYVEYFLKEIKKNLECLVVVVNGYLDASEKEKLLPYADKVIERENKGLDIWGYKTGLDYFGWEKLSEYDEVLVVNNTILGPVYPFSEMFDEMGKRNLDFWGMTRHYSVDFNPFASNMYGYIPEHIQSYFVVFRKSFICTSDFQNYWDKLIEFNNYEEAVGRHEIVFTKMFADKGYLWDTYVDTEDMRDLIVYPLMTEPKRLIKEKKCPIFKRRTFFQSYDYMVRNTTGQTAMELMNYLKENNLYDVDMIWENIIRTCNQADIVKNLQLQYILPSNIAPFEKVDGYMKGKKIALIMHLNFDDLIEKSFKYAQSMPVYADIYITTNAEKKKNKIEKYFSELDNKIEVRLIENRGRDIGSILVGVKDVIMDYDIACFVHDKKTAYHDQGSVGDSYVYKCFENTLHNKEFVYNVINTFIENPRLGLLSPPAPNHADFFSMLGHEWGNYFESTKKLAADLGIDVSMEENKEPVAMLGTFFWFRPSAFKVLYDKEWTYEDFSVESDKMDDTLLHTMERIYPYAVQQEGFYPGLLMVDKFAGIEVTNLSYYVREYNKVFAENQIFDYQNVMVEHLRETLKANKELSDRLGNCLETHKQVCDEWTKTADSLNHLQKDHEYVCDEWAKTADSFNHLQKDHEYVCDEWAKTADSLNHLQKDHEYVCDEWAKTVDSLNELRMQYDNIIKSRSWRILSSINRVFDKFKQK